jgi:MoxR-like ATPase
MRFMTVRDGDTVTLQEGGEAQPERVHVFSQQEIDAVNAALGAGRPLLVRGEPGIGKTQLGEAVADHLGRVMLPFVVDVRSESRDLLWHLDAVQRLADAQLLGAAGKLSFSRDPARPDAAEPIADQGDNHALERSLVRMRQTLAIEHYLHPGPLWWAFDWEDARKQAERAQLAPPRLEPPAEGVLVLIDEIDKAESDLPNGLLEALGSRSFTPHGRSTPVLARDKPPLVIITTNEERVLPDAFLRRCLVLHLRLPDEDTEALVGHLIGRGKAHFYGEDAPFSDEDAAVLEQAARQLAGDRKAAQDNQWYPLPGQAEYLDLVRAVRALEPEPASQLKRLNDLGRYLLKKHPEAERAGVQARSREADEDQAPH